MLKISSHLTVVEEKKNINSRLIKFKNSVLAKI